MKTSIIYRWLLVAAFTCAVGLVNSSVAFPFSEILGPKRSTVGRITTYYRYLSRFKEECGRYPLTSEGLKAIWFLPPGLNCPKFSRPSGLTDDGGKYFRYTIIEPIDSWQQPIHYTSDGVTYRLEASHGYYLTDQSKKRDTGAYWENPNPPPDGPPSERTIQKWLTPSKK